MIIFAAGNKYKTSFNTKPVLVHGYYYVFAFKWIKSKNEWAANPKTFNIGPAYEDITDEA